jgi:hypothetical protein
VHLLGKSFSGGSVSLPVEEVVVVARRQQRAVVVV